MKKSLNILTVLIFIISVLLFFASIKDNLLLRYILFIDGTIKSDSCPQEFHGNGNIHDPRNSNDQNFYFNKNSSSQENLRIATSSRSTWGLFDIDEGAIHFINSDDHNYVLYINNTKLPISTNPDSILLDYTYFKYDQIPVYFPGGQIVVAMNLRPILYLNCE